MARSTGFWRRSTEKSVGGIADDSHYSELGPKRLDNRLVNSIQRNGGRCFNSKISFVEMLFEQRRHHFGLDAIAANLPGTGALKYGQTFYARTQGNVHWQAVAADEVSMVLDITDVF